MTGKAFELTVVVPTFNERDNIQRLLDLLDVALTHVQWEVVFVDDDSPDGTSEHIRRISQRDGRVRCLQRLGRRGLSSACLEGIMSSAAPYVAIMDCDLQHDESLLPKMLAELKTGNADLVNGSRYMAGGDSREGLSPMRSFYSRFATFIAQALLRVTISDPMSGFFMFRREALMPAIRRSSGQGFKILLDLLASARGHALRVVELPYQMRSREAGESKLDTLVLWEYAVLLADKSIGRFIPVRFVLFVLVGMSGVLVHLAVLALMHRVLGFEFLTGQVAATLVAMTSNFVLNNVFTYRDRRLQGKDFYIGLMTFYIACSLGAVINFLVSDNLYESGFVWWLSGVIGAFVGAVWNYAMTYTFTWGKKAKDR